MKNLLLLFLFTINLIGCSAVAEYQEDFEPVNSNIEYLYDQSFIDNSSKICINLPNTSLVGRLHIHDGDFLFVDNKFCRIYVFDSTGEFKNRFFDSGGGPSEIITREITGYTPLAGKGHFVIGGNNYMLFNSSCIKLAHGVLNNNENGKGDPSDPSIYTMSYEKFILRSHGDYVYYNMTLQHPKYNFVANPSVFYKTARNIFVADIKTGEVVEMLGKYPSMYKNGRHNQFSLINFDVDKYGGIVLSFEACETIYLYNENFEPTVCFGLKGRDMRTDYPALTTVSEFRDNYSSHRQNYSYYSDIEAIDDINYVARIYLKDSDTSDGIQIYNKNYALIADLSIPKGYKISGSYDKKLYLYRIDEMNDRIDIIILKL